MIYENSTTLNLHIWAHRLIHPPEQDREDILAIVLSQLMLCQQVKCNSYCKECKLST